MQVVEASHCIVCLEPLGTHGGTFTSHCNHATCVQCARDWVQTSHARLDPRALLYPKPFCPVCKRCYTKTDYAQLGLRAPCPCFRLRCPELPRCAKIYLVLAIGALAILIPCLIVTITLYMNDVNSSMPHPPSIVTGPTDDHGGADLDGALRFPLQFHIDRPLLLVWLDGAAYHTVATLEPGQCQSLTTFADHHFRLYDGTTGHCIVHVQARPDRARAGSSQRRSSEVWFDGSLAVLSSVPVPGCGSILQLMGMATASGHLTHVHLSGRDEQAQLQSSDDSHEPPPVTLSLINSLLDCSVQVVWEGTVTDVLLPNTASLHWSWPGHTLHFEPMLNHLACWKYVNQLVPSNIHVLSSWSGRYQQFLVHGSTRS